jgi:Hint domain
MMNDQENLSSGAQRTRRNIMKIGVILASSAVAASSAHALKSSTSSISPCASSLCKCFLKGTKIQTAEGERRVEDLAIGDLLPTMSADCVPSNLSDAIQPGGVIRRNRGSRTRCRFALPAPLSRPMFRMPIST